MQLFIKAFVIASVLGQAVSIQFQRLATTNSIPSCSIDCMETLVPEFCGSLTNITCICTDTTLTAELTVCALAACNVTDSFRLEAYKADLCRVPNDEMRLREQLIGYEVTPPIATLFLLARVYTRATMETLGPDDWMMIAAWGFYLVDLGTGAAMMVNKFGLHTYELTTKQMENNLMFFYTAEIWYIITITLTKLSLLLFFRRIFPSRNFKLATWALVAYTSISNFAVLMALTFQCVPFQGSWTNWEYKVYPVKCINTYAVVYFAASNSIAQDLAIVALPIPALLKLNLPWQKKANLLVMFSIGFFVILCSILRLPSLIKLKTSTDPSWDQAPIAIWTNLEQSIGIICGCLPACRALAGHIFPSLKMSFDKATGSSAANYAKYNPSRRPSKGKLASAGDHSFMELCDQNISLSKLKSKKHGLSQNDSDEFIRTVNSNESKMPINSDLEDISGKRCGASTEIHAEGNGEGVKRMKGPGITLTREVKLSRS